MFDSLPRSYQVVRDWSWEEYKPYYDDVMQRPVRAATLDAWMADSSTLLDLLTDTFWRLAVAQSLDTTDEAAERRYTAFVEHVMPSATEAENGISKKLLDSGLEPPRFAVPLRNLRAQVDLFREENLPLLVEERKLSSVYDKIVGAQSVEWEGGEVTVPQLQPVYQDADRSKRERAWRLAMRRSLQDREAMDELWVKLLEARRQKAANAGKADYRAYSWQQLNRFDYTPADCETFHNAIEEVVVPVAERLYEQRRRQLGVDSLRPWDLDVDVFGRAPLRPFQSVDELVSKTAIIFDQVDGQLGAHFRSMSDRKLLDLDNRKGKAPGGYCTYFPVERVPFIFMNAVGVHTDVDVLLHEAGHAFHIFEMANLPYFFQYDWKALPIEFVEVASMAMELLAAPYLKAEQGGFYSRADAARACAEHLEGIIRFWPYMAVVDAFQHWVYTHVDEAADPARCSEQWSELWHRFMKGVDWSGLDEEMATGWQRKLHIFQIPFYYIEYGLAQLGAIQVWKNSLANPIGAVAQYRRALALGGTEALPTLFATAGAKFAFDAATLRSAVELIEKTIVDLGDNNASASHRVSEPHS